MDESIMSSRENFVDSGEKNRLKIEEQCITTNWILTQENKRLSDVISIITSTKASKRLTLEEIATEDSCVILQPVNVNIDSEKEACVVDINLTERKISRIGVVSEASVIEFFKESGEYAGTEFAELIDEYEGATVYLAQLTFQKPTSQASVKFTRIHNSRSNMYLYGMRLVIEKDDNLLSNERRTFEDLLKNLYIENIATEKNRAYSSDVKNIPDYDGNFSTEIDACLTSFMERTKMTRGDDKSSKKQDRTDRTIKPIKEDKDDETRQDSQKNIESYIDEKFRDMEKRLMERINEVEEKTTEKLDVIIKRLQSLNNTS